MGDSKVFLRFLGPSPERFILTLGRAVKRDETIATTQEKADLLLATGAWAASSAPPAPAKTEGSK